MEYVVDHEIIKLWDTYKPMIYLKDGPHTSPLMGLNMGQYTKPLTNFKNAQGSPKTGYDAAQMLSCVAIVEQK